MWEKKKSQNINVISSHPPTSSSLWPSGWLWLYCPKPEPQWTLSRYSLWNHMHSHWHLNIHDFLWDYKVRERMAWQKAGRENSEPNWNPKCYPSLGRRNPRTLNHLKKACLPILSMTTWLHLSSQTCQEGTTGALSNHPEQTDSSSPSEYPVSSF